MKKILWFSLFSVICLVLGSCGSSKNIAYFKNADSLSYLASKGLFDAKIMPKDLLTITVSTTDPKVSTPFNLSVSNTLTSTGQVGNGGVSLQTYLVGNDGYINFPVIGKLKVGGMTKSECEDYICKSIKPYLAEEEKPIVTVKMASFKVTVAGEVKSPGVFIIDQEKINVIEALARAGDLTIYGRRENVLLIREDETGQKSLRRINLNDANLINSPYYYLQQNDILYVEPNSVQAKNSAIGSSTTIWFSVVGILTSVASLMVNILRN
ncbi:MAG: polysaccharide biosynthesis/export family protein [Paraprevotella sp.]|nr:polysaccharide biosynthesis/export family protein [Paraprevotella sp.]MDD5855233.1 polysaccharide biosynthesis/export family protein [Prevotella sp.]